MRKAELFNSVKLRRPKSNGFDLSHEVKTTGNMGDLIPILCQEVIPGDKFRCRSEIFCRFMPMLAPVMQRMDIYTHYFFVPNRLLWNVHEQTDSWKAFITGGREGNLTPEPPHFYLPDLVNIAYHEVESENSNILGKGSLWDYFGLPTIDGDDLRQGYAGQFNKVMREKILAFPFIAYQLIYDEYYRDQNYQDEIIEDKSSIPGGQISDDTPNIDVFDLLTVRKRAWKKDYFTSALPWSQRLAEPVDFPLVGNIDVYGAGSSNSKYVTIDTVLPNSTSEGNLLGVIDGTGNGLGYGLGELNQFDKVVFNGSGRATLKGVLDCDKIIGEGDLSNVSAINVQMLREGLRLQEWLERNAVGGARYVEQIYAHFGEMVPDATVQRPIYLGGGKQVIRVSEVLQSVESDTTALGDMAGHGVSVGRTHGFNNRKFTEHGFIIGIMSVIPKASYMQSLNKKWSRFDKLDYYFPEFAHLGEQEVKVKELKFGWFDEDNQFHTSGRMNDETFGYQSRFAEYKFNSDVICGEFKDTLDYWHLGRQFDRQFVNNIDFLEVQPEETERIFAVQDHGATHKLLFQIYHDMQAIRLMPKFATPYI